MQASTVIANKDYLARFRSVNAEHRDEARTSDKYSFVSTRQLVDTAIDAGFSVRSVKSAGDYGTHLVNLTPPGFVGDALKVGDSVPQIVLRNSHNGQSALFFALGYYRLVCCNGLVVGNSLFDVRLPHRGLQPALVHDALHKAMDNLRRIEPKVVEMQRLTLSTEQVQRFGLAAISARASLSGLTQSETADLLNRSANLNRAGRVARAEDSPRTLWNVFNVLQENLVKKGGYFYRKDDSKGALHQFGTLQAPRGVDTLYKLNRDLWNLAESYVS